MKRRPAGVFRPSLLFLLVVAPIGSASSPRPAASDASTIQAKHLAADTGCSGLSGAKVRRREEINMPVESTPSNSLQLHKSDAPHSYRLLKCLLASAVYLCCSCQHGPDTGADISNRAVPVSSAQTVNSPLAGSSPVCFA
jgi:hypothetical protein